MSRTMANSGFGVTQFLLLANLAVMTGLAMTSWRSADATFEPYRQMDAASMLPPLDREPLPEAVSNIAESDRTTTGGGGTEPLPSSHTFVGDGSPHIGQTDAAGYYFVTPREGERNFYEIAKTTLTDKVTAPAKLPGCLKSPNMCTRPGCKREECRPWGHHYDTIYQQRLGPYSRDDVEPFQFLEVGFYHGAGYDTYREFMPKGECHSIEIACIEPGPREEGKWPWGNFPADNPRYQQYLDENRLHCGDGNNVAYLDKVWKNDMNRSDAPPLKIVVDDGAHIAKHMAQTVFFWFPKIEPRGLLIVEDIQPISEANEFRTQFLPQIMKDLHYCGDPKQNSDDVCFPTLMPLLASIHCEMHICIFERNDKPAVELSLEESTMPESALDISKCKSQLPGKW